MRQELLMVAAPALAAILGACGGGTPNRPGGAPGTSGASSGASSSPSSTAPPGRGAPSTAACAGAPGANGGNASGTGDVRSAGDIPDSQAFVAFHPSTGRYTIEVPEGWARTEEGRVVTFTDKLNSLRVELRPRPTAPTVASARSEEVPVLQSTNRCFELGKVTTVTRPAGDAVVLAYRADGAPDPVTGRVVREEAERYEFWKAGTEAVVTLSAPQGSDNVDPWRTITQSFAWTP